MMGACGADNDVGVVLRQTFKKLRFQMIVHTVAVRAASFVFAEMMLVAIDSAQIKYGWH